MNIPSFYSSSTTPLTWSQWFHNVGTEALWFHGFSSYTSYEKIDSTTFLRERIIIRLPPSVWRDYLLPIAKVMLAATIIAPCFCYWVSHPTASDASWHHLDQLYSHSSEQPAEITKLLTDFVAETELSSEEEIDGSLIEENSTSLYQLMVNYREQGLEVALLAHLITLDPALKRELADIVQNKGSEAFKRRLYLAVAGESTSKELLCQLYPLLSADDQLALLQSWSRKEADYALTKLLPLSVKAAEAYPVELLSTILPLELGPAHYGLLSGSEERGFDLLFTRAPKTTLALSTLTLELPREALLRLFWRSAQGGWIEPNSNPPRFVPFTTYFKRELEAICKMPLATIEQLEPFGGQPWKELWQRTQNQPVATAAVV